jgi:hypothetical protein
MLSITTEEAMQILLDQIAAQRVVLMGLTQALSRNGTMDLDTFAEQLLALRLSGETEGAVKARGELAEMIRAGARSTPPSLRIVKDQDEEDH